MAKSGVFDYSTTAASNTDLDGLDSTGTTGLVKSGDNYTRSLMSHVSAFALDLGGAKTTTGSANAHAVTLTQTITALVTGVVFRVKWGFTNTAAATLNANTLGAKSIKVTSNGVLSDPLAGDIVAGNYGNLVYDGTYYVLLDPSRTTHVLHQQVFSASGTFTTPANSTIATVYKIEMIGGGGAGGSTSAGSATGGGGGVGGYARFYYSGIAPSTGITITIGAGGSPTVGTGGTGGTTSVGAPISVSCAGGVGGTGSAGATNVVGGVGGAVTGSITNGIAFTGAQGGSSLQGSISGGYGAASQFGGGGVPGATSIGLNGASPSAYGAGGGGAVGNPGSGGAGLQGIVIIEWVL